MCLEPSQVVGLAVEAKEAGAASPCTASPCSVVSRAYSRASAHETQEGMSRLCPDVNLARNRPAEQSSTYHWNTADKAVDGGIFGYFVDHLNQIWTNPYGGSDAGNMGSVLAEDVASHGRERSLSLLLPPLILSSCMDGP